VPPPTRPQLAAYGALALVVLVLGGRWMLTRAQGTQGTAPAPVVQPPGGGEAGGGAGETAAGGGSGETAAGASPGADALVVVHVAGAVRRPGVYRLRKGLRVQDAVRRAGGATARADPNAINLAAPVQDGVQILVPRRGQAAVSAPGAAGAPGGPATPAAPVNLNTATEEQLETLDGVGPATAAKILAWRSEHGGFRSIEDLGQVSGIGPKKLAVLRGKVTV
jgi:competence protein ComEA